MKLTTFVMAANFPSNGVPDTGWSKLIHSDHNMPHFAPRL